MNNTMGDGRLAIACDDRFNSVPGDYKGVDLEHKRDVDLESAAGLNYLVGPFYATPTTEELERRSEKNGTLARMFTGCHEADDLIRRLEDFFLEWDRIPGFCLEDMKKTLRAEYEENLIAGNRNSRVMKEIGGFRRELMKLGFVRYPEDLVDVPEIDSLARGEGNTFPQPIVDRETGRIVYLSVLDRVVDYLVANGYLVCENLNSDSEGSEDSGMDNGFARRDGRRDGRHYDSGRHIYSPTDKMFYVGEKTEV